MVVGVKCMVEIVRNVVDVVLIDMIGFVMGVGVEMKCFKVELVKFDIIVVIYLGEFLGLVKVLELYGGVIELVVSEIVKRYFFEERRNLCVEKWWNYFRDF